MDWFFAKHRWAGTPHKCAEVAWHSLDQLPSPIPAYERMVMDGLAPGDLSVCTAVRFAR